MRFDLHMHTTRHSPDSEMDPFVLVRRARQIGLDGRRHHRARLAVDRDGAGGAARAPCPAWWCWRASRSARWRAFPGLRRSGPFAVPRGIGVADLCREVHRQGGAVVAAHPFRWGQPFEDILEEERPELDGLELMTSNMDAECRKRAAAVWRRAAHWPAWARVTPTMKKFWGCVILISMRPSEPRRTWFGLFGTVAVACDSYIKQLPNLSPAQRPGVPPS